MTMQIIHFSLSEQATRNMLRNGGQLLLENEISRRKREGLQQLLADDVLTFDLLKMTVKPNHQCAESLDWSLSSLDSVSSLFLMTLGP